MEVIGAEGTVMLEAWALAGETRRTETAGNAMAPMPNFCKRARRVTPNGVAAPAKGRVRPLL